MKKMIRNLAGTALVLISGSALADSSRSHILDAFVVDQPVGQAASGPAHPGQSYEFTVEAGHNTHFRLYSMLGESNDYFFNTPSVALWNWSGRGPFGNDYSWVPNEGALPNIWLTDAGTEANEPFGSGLNQGPRQSGPNQGPDDPVSGFRNGGFATAWNLPLVGSSFVRGTIQHIDGNVFKVRIDVLASSPSGISPLAVVVYDQYPYEVDPTAAITPGMSPRDSGIEALAEDGQTGPLVARFLEHRSL